VCLNAARKEAYLALCSSAERERYARIRHAETRGHHLLTRALVRSALSHYVVREPQSWRFVENDHGCPFIAPEQNSDELHFNVSHTQGMIVCAVTRGRALGVDVEYEARKSRTTKIAHRFFAPSEVAALKRLPEADQRKRFFTYWTLKEAYIKARGMGLAIPLKHFWFDVEKPGFIAFDNDPILNDDPSMWRFVRLYAERTHPIAIALGGAPPRDFVIQAFKTVPLEGHEPLDLRIIARSE